jgi:hypothetical protein
MPYQNISATLTEDHMLFLISLTPDERRKCLKMGDKRLALGSI